MTIDGKDVTVALVGIGLTGACLGLSHGAVPMAMGALALPLLALGVPLLTLPALYIGAAYAQASPPPAALLSGARSGARACGLFLLGALPSLLFLVATSTPPAMDIRLASIAALAGIAFGMQSMLSSVRGSHESTPFALLFAAWGVVTIVIGSILLVRGLRLVGE